MTVLFCRGIVYDMRTIVLDTFILQFRLSLLILNARKL